MSDPKQQQPGREIAAVYFKTPVMVGGQGPDEWLIGSSKTGQGKTSARIDWDRRIVELTYERHDGLKQWVGVPMENVKSITWVPVSK